MNQQSNGRTLIGLFLIALGLYLLLATGCSQEIDVLTSDETQVVQVDTTLNFRADTCEWDLCQNDLIFIFTPKDSALCDCIYPQKSGAILGSYNNNQFYPMRKTANGKFDIYIPAGTTCAKLPINLYFVTYDNCPIECFAFEVELFVQGGGTPGNPGSIWPAMDICYDGKTGSLLIESWGHAWGANGFCFLSENPAWPEEPENEDLEPCESFVCDNDPILCP